MHLLYCFGLARSVDYVAPHVRLLPRDSLLRRRNIKRQAVARKYHVKTVNLNNALLFLLGISYSPLTLG